LDKAKMAPMESSLRKKILILKVGCIESVESIFTVVG